VDFANSDFTVGGIAGHSQEYRLGSGSHGPESEAQAAEPNTERGACSLFSRLARSIAHAAHAFGWYNRGARV